jgi:hypothetical protein
MMLPGEIDGLLLTDSQSVVLAEIVKKLVIEAQYDLEPAVLKALDVFKCMFENTGVCWRPKKTIRLKEHAGIVKNKFYRFDLKASEDMGRKLAKPKPEPVEFEKEKLLNMVDEAMLKNVEKKLGKKLVKKGSKS